MVPRKSLRHKSAIFILLLIVAILSVIVSKRPDIHYIQPVNTFPKNIKKPIKFDLQEIIKRDTLVALTQYNANSYFLFRGETMGFEYELLKLFAKELGVELVLKTPSTEDSLFIMLNSGAGDLIAADLAITKERTQHVSFSTPHNTTRMVIVQRRDTSGNAQIKSAIDLIGKTVSIRPVTPYLLRLENLIQETGGVIHIDTISEEYETEDLIRMVNDGEIPLTIANENIAKVNANLYPDLNMNVIISSPQRIAWAFRTTSPNLVSATNKWMKDMRSQNTSPYTTIYNKYYGNKEHAKKVQESQFYSLSTGTITPYDSLFKANQTTLFRWTLLASLAYQESKFDTKAESWVGAVGIMQLLPSTILEMGESNGLIPSQGIRAAAKYLEHLRLNYWNNLSDSESIKFTLASYNAGVSHILDAQRLAKVLNLNPKVWDENVELAALKLTDRKYFYNPVVEYGYCRCGETFHFVNQIMARTSNYDKVLLESEHTKVRDSIRTSERKNSNRTVAH